jgi:shikimate dehydrogenase
MSEEEALGELALGGLEVPETVVDLVYGNDVTPLSAWARAGGALVVNGLEVLVRQGARSLELWTERKAPVAAMRRAASAAHV